MAELYSLIQSAFKAFELIKGLNKVGLSRTDHQTIGYYLR